MLQVWSGFTDFGLKSDFLRQRDLIREWFYSSPNSFFLSLFCILWFFTFTKRFGWAQVGLIWSNEWVVEWVLVILCNMNCTIVFSYVIWYSVRDRLLHCNSSLLMYDSCIGSNMRVFEFLWYHVKWILLSFSTMLFDI